MDAESWLTAEEAMEDGFATKILEEEETGINQSAFRMIRDKILASKNGYIEAEALETGIVMADADEIAEKVTEKIKAMLKKEEQQAQKKKMDTGWGVFFSGKGEKK